MITTPTVLILGAGSSAPYGYPTGKELRLLIVNEFDGIAKNYVHHDHSEMLDKWINTVNTEAKKLRDYFSKSSTHSIDLFIARNTTFEEIGKRAIAAFILRAEANSKFREEINNEKQDWYTYLFTRMTTELASPDGYKSFHKNKVSFVTFNYDRSLEHFLYESIKFSFADKLIKDDTYKIATKEKELVTFPILHVYGKLADLPWQSNEGLEYGSRNLIPFINHMIGNIRVIYDRANHEIEKIKDLISNAERIFFLGFSYAPENLQILGIPEILKIGQQIYGSVLGFSNKEKK